MSTFAPTGPTGYTCPTCRSWVPNGVLHTCQRTAWPQSVAPNMPKLIDVRIAEALERIADALEQMNASQHLDAPQEDA